MVSWRERHEDIFTFYVYVEVPRAFQKPANVNEIPQNTSTFLFCVFVVYLTTLLGNQIIVCSVVRMDGKNMEGSGRVLISGTNQKSPWRD
jgi:hypothetical protein